MNPGSVLRVTLLPLVCGVLITACANNQNPGQSARNVVTFDCTGGLWMRATFYPGEGRMILDDDAEGHLILTQLVSADGARYADHSVEFWNVGNTATITDIGSSKKHVVHCEARPPNAS